MLDSPGGAGTTRAPLLAATVAGVLAAALAVIYFVVVLPDDSSGSRSASSGGGFTATERTAMTAASTEAVNLQSLTRAHFDADWQRAIDGTTGALRSDLVKDKAKTLKALQDAKTDLRAEVTHTGLIGKTDDGKGYLVLVTLQGYQVSGKQQSLPTPQRLQLTVVNVKGKWLASDVTQRGLS